MKASLININVSHVTKVLEEKHSEFLKLFPEELSNRLNDEMYFAGGCIYSLYKGNDYKDIDTFVESKELIEDILTHVTNESSLSLRASTTGKIKLGTYKGFRLIITDNAITIGDYQLIIKDWGTPENVISQFDFKHNMYYYKQGKIYRLVSASYLTGNELCYNDNRVRDIAGTIARVPKFVSRGMTIKNTEMNRMLLYLHQVGFNDKEIETLELSQLDTSFGS